MRTDIAVVPLPSKLPNFGGLLGMNITQVDPDFGTTIIRATDSSINTAALQTADEAQAGIWSVDDSLLITRNNNGGSQILSFINGKFADTKLPHYAPIRFSGVTPNVFYEIVKSKVTQFTLSQVNGKWTTKTKDICDFANILPSGFKVKWVGTFGMSLDDSTFCVAFSEGPQQTGFHTCLFRVGSGYRMLDTHSGMISNVGGWGPTGPAVLTSPNFKFPFSLHESNCTPNPKYATLGASAGVSDTMVWAVDTLNINEVMCTGHAARGVSHIYPGGVGGGNVACYAYTDVSKTGRTLVLDPKQLPPGYIGDRHYGFGKFDPNDNSIIWSSSLNLKGITAAWENEVFGYDIVKKVVYRACHTFGSGKSPYFITLNTMACPSQTGKDVAFSSDMMQTLGTTTGKESSKAGPKDIFRGDVFIAQVIL